MRLLPDGRVNCYKSRYPVSLKLRIAKHPYCVAMSMQCHGALQENLWTKRIYSFNRIKKNSTKKRKKKERLHFFAGSCNRMITSILVLPNVWSHTVTKVEVKVFL